MSCAFIDTIGNKNTGHAPDQWPLARLKLAKTSHPHRCLFREAKESITGRIREGPKLKARTRPGNLKSLERYLRQQLEPQRDRRREQNPLLQKNKGGFRLAEDAIPVFMSDTDKRAMCG